LLPRNGNNVEATFDFVEATFDFVERIVRLVALDNVASTLLLVRTGLKALKYGITRNHTVSPATHTFTSGMIEPYLPLLPSRSASQRFGCYSFPTPLRVGS